MNTLTLHIPESLHKGAEAACQRDGISLDQFISLAIAEKLSALLTEEYLQQRAQKGSRSQYEAALAQIPDAEPDARDQW